MIETIFNFLIDGFVFPVNNSYFFFPRGLEKKSSLEKFFTGLLLVHYVAHEFLPDEILDPPLLA